MSSNFFNHCPICIFFNFGYFRFWFQLYLLLDKSSPTLHCTLRSCHHHHRLHHGLQWILRCLCLRSLCCSVSFWMLVRTILTSTICTKFAFDFRMQIKTSFSECACWKVLTLFGGMNEWTGLAIFTIWKMLAFYLFFLAQLAAAEGTSVYGRRRRSVFFFGLSQNLLQVDSFFRRLVFFTFLLGAESFHTLFASFIRSKEVFIFVLILSWSYLITCFLSNFKLSFVLRLLIIWFL